MANEDHSRVLLNASFNQDFSYFSVCSKDGYRILNSKTGDLRYENSKGGVGIVEMLYNTSLLAIVGSGEQPALSPRRLLLFNTVDEESTKLTFVNAILAVRLNRQWLVVVLQNKVYVYDLDTTTILDEIDTVPNKKGLCAFSPSQDNCFLALPASNDKGLILVYNVKDLHSHSQINAHNSPLAAMTMSSNGDYLATASEQGTVIRVFSVSQACKLFSFRRGTYPATIYSLSFGPTSQSPEVLVCSSSTGSLHVFTLGLISGERKRRPMGLISAVIPDSVNDAIEPTYHHIILHNVLPRGVKNCVAITDGGDIDMDESNSTRVNIMPTSPVHKVRAQIYSITYSGYFSIYSVVFDNHNNSKWNLDRESYLITSPSDEISATFII